MKKLLVVVVVLAIALFAAVAMAGVSGSKHDLSVTGTGSQHANAGQQQEEICVWCHTPHSSNAGMKPLWNKSVPSTAYTAYGNTIGGSTAGAPGAVSKACLSCHDGVNAINNLVNQAGSGGYNASGTLVAFGGTAAGSNALMANANYVIGTDLSNDHPIGFAYNASLSRLRALTGTGAIAKVTATNAVSGGAGALVECSSCHDPHGVTGTFSFLRISNTSSALCLACHTL